MKIDKLFADSEVFQNDRPKHLTEEQEEQFYYDFAAGIKQSGFSKSKIERIIEDLKELSVNETEGFELVSELKNKFIRADYNFSTAFCEHMDFFHSDYEDIANENVKQWVKAHNIEPKLHKGDKVIFKTNPSRWISTGEPYYIRGIKTELAQYLIHEEENHKGGYVLNYEDIENNIAT